MKQCPSRSRLIQAGILLALLSLPARAEDTVQDFSPKFSFRLGNGLLSNSGSAGGSSISYLSPHLSFHYFFGPKFSVGAAYRLDLDYALGNVSLHGFYFPVRYHFFGNGTKVRYRAHDEVLSERHDRLSFYLGLEVSRSGYFLGSNPERTTQDLTGSFMGLGAALGGDLRLSQHVELTSEVNYGFMSFASSDDRIKIKGWIFLLGINYLW